MEFQAGDKVMHSTYGLGQVVAIEERTINENTGLYYMIQVADLTIWVPVDENLKNRLRFPASKTGFKELLSILSRPAEQLPGDRRERTLLLQQMVKDGGLEPLCKAIRDLTAYRHSHAWNDYDNAFLKRAIDKLIGEWSVSLSVEPREAERELQKMLAHIEN